MFKKFNSTRRLLRRKLGRIYHLAVSLLPEELQLTIWERKILRVTRKEFQNVTDFIQDGAVVIDVGANVGAFTQILLDQCPNCKAYLFEPVPKYFNFCVNKFSRNKNVTVEDYALSDQKGNATIYVSKTNPGANTLLKEKRPNSMKQLDINAVYRFLIMP